MSSTPFPVSRRGVIRFLLDAQGLAGRPTSGRAASDPPKSATPSAVLREVRRLECVQIDPVAAVERNQHLALAARMPAYLPKVLEDLLARARVFEYLANAACVIPMEDYPIFEGTRRRVRERLAPALDKLSPVVRRIREALKANGPLPARAFTSDDRVHGYWDLKDPKTKATSHALNLLLDAGEVMIARRQGAGRYFDLPGKVVPSDLLHLAERISTSDADEAMLQKYLRAYRIFDTGDPRFGWRRMTAAARRDAVHSRIRSGAVVPLAVEGVRRQYLALAEDLEALARYDRAARMEKDGTTGVVMRFLPPLDNLLWRRERIADLFDFQYSWEVYLPAARRQYGYYAMPILFGDRLIGRIDPRLDRQHGRLVIRLLQMEPRVRVTKALRASLREALEAFAHFHGAHTLVVERVIPDGLLR